ncbi:VOC family protein [Longispora urticae]
MSGKVVHFEIPTDDQERARAFYARAFGWKVDAVPDMEYAMAGTVDSDEQGMPTEIGAINGGLAPRRGPLTSPVLTIDVPDIDDALARVVEFGGTVVEGRQEVMGMGFTGYFADSEGNTIGLWQNASPS